MVHLGVLSLMRTFVVVIEVSRDNEHIIDHVRR